MTPMRMRGRWWEVRGGCSRSNMRLVSLMCWVLFSGWWVGGKGVGTRTVCVCWGIRLRGSRAHPRPLVCCSGEELALGVGSTLPCSGPEAMESLPLCLRLGGGPGYGRAWPLGGLPAKPARCGSVFLPHTHVLPPQCKHRHTHQPCVLS